MLSQAKGGANEKRRRVPTAPPLRGARQNQGQPLGAGPAAARARPAPTPLCRHGGGSGDEDDEQGVERGRRLRRLRDHGGSQH